MHPLHDVSESTQDDWNNMQAADYENCGENAISPYIDDIDKIGFTISSYFLFLFSFVGFVIGLIYIFSLFCSVLSFIQQRTIGINTITIIFLLFVIVNTSLCVIGNIAANNLSNKAKNICNEIECQPSCDLHDKIDKNIDNTIWNNINMYHCVFYCYRCFDCTDVVE